MSTDLQQVLEKQRQYVRSGASAVLATRRQQLERLRRLIVEEEAELCDAVYKDLRRAASYTKSLELGQCLTEIQYMLDHLEEWTRPEYVEKTLAQMLDTPMVVRDPYGCCLLIAPWNYPMAMALLPLVALLAAGNTVVVKPSEASGNSALALQKAFAKHLDPESVAVVLADVPGTQALLKERFDLIVYTGNGVVGRHIMKAAAEHLTPVVLELGGKSPVLVDRCADIHATARRICWGKFLNNGQTCISPDYLLVHKSVKAELIAEFHKVIPEFYGKDVQASKDYSRIINERHFDRLKSLLDRSKGTIVGQFGVLDRTDRFIPPTFVDVQPDDALMQDELFGPILPIITVDHLDEAIEFLNGDEKPLALYVFSRDHKRVDQVVNHTRSGAVTVNDVVMHFTVDTLPFGGVGNSGMGAYRGKYGFEQFSHKKAVLKRPFFGEQLGAARYPPMTDKKMAALAKLSKRVAVPRWAKRFLANWDLFLAGILLSVFVGVSQKYLTN